MIFTIQGVLGKLKTLNDNFTAARAAKLDYLTAAVAVASTALSTATWTSARAAKLDAVVQTSSPLIAAPIEPFITPDNAFSNFGAPGVETVAAQNIAAACGGTLHTVVGTTWTIAVDITGKGVLNLVSLVAEGQVAKLSITVDGEALVAVKTCPASGGKSYIGSAVYNAAGGYAQAALDQIPFHSSVQIAHQSMVAGGKSHLIYKYRRTE